MVTGQPVTITAPEILAATTNQIGRNVIVTSKFMLILVFFLFFTGSGALIRGKDYGTFQ